MSYLNTYSMYRDWSFSFVKLINNYSKEFSYKISNPKISRIPMNLAGPLPIFGFKVWFIFCTKKSNKF